jgi:hypothetical protein
MARIDSSQPRNAGAVDLQVFIAVNTYSLKDRGVSAAKIIRPLVVFFYTKDLNTCSAADRPYRRRRPADVPARAMAQVHDRP